VLHRVGQDPGEFAIDRRAHLDVLRCGPSDRTVKHESTVVPAYSESTSGETTLIGTGIFGASAIGLDVGSLEATWPRGSMAPRARPH